MSASQPDPFTDAERELLLEAAQAVVRRGLAVPAMMFLETMAPMNTVTSSMLMILSPIWRVALPASRIDAVAKVLERREAIPELLRIIDDEEDKRRRDQSEDRARRRGQRRRWFGKRRNASEATAVPSADERRGA